MKFYINDLYKIYLKIIFIIFFNIRIFNGFTQYSSRSEPSEDSYSPYSYYKGNIQVSHLVSQSTPSPSEDSSSLVSLKTPHEDHIQVSYNIGESQLPSCVHVGQDKLEESPKKWKF